MTTGSLSLQGCDLQGFVHQLSRHMGCDIKRLARALNAECTYVELERQYPRDLKEIIRLFFERWLKTERDCAPIGQLMRGLKEAELSDTYNKMETYMKEGISCRVFIKELSRHIGCDLRKFARALNVDKTDLDAIEFHDPRDLKEQIVQFFKFWEEREGSRASIETLMAGLKKAELFEVVEKMELFLKQAAMCQVSHDGDGAGTKSTLLPQQKALHKHGVVKTESCRVVKGAETHFVRRERCNSDGANLRNARPQNRHSNSHHTSKSISTCNETEIQLVFFCPNSVTLNELQCLAKGTDLNIQTLSTSTPSGSVRAVINGNFACCYDVLNKYLKQKFNTSQNILSKLVTIENRHQWGQVVGPDACINKAIKNLSGAEVWIENVKDYPMPCHVTGLPEQVEMAEELLRRAMQGDDIVKEATAENILSRIKKDLVQFCGFQFESMA